MPIVIIDDNGCKTSCRTLCRKTRKKSKRKKKGESINYALLAAVMADQRRTSSSRRGKKSRSAPQGTLLLGNGGGNDYDDDDGISVWGDPYTIASSSYYDDDEDDSSATPFPMSQTSSASSFTFGGSTPYTQQTISSLTQSSALDDTEDGESNFDAYQNYVPSFDRPKKRSRVFDEFSNVQEVD